MLDMYDFENDICLCHTFHGKCFNYTAFQPAINVLKEVQAFLEANPIEIITIIIEDYVTSENGLTKIFKAAGLSKFSFPVSRMPSNGTNWPTVDSMIQENQRLVVFTSKSSKEASEGIAYVWRYLVENQYGSDGMKNGSCPNRAESATMNITSRSLVRLNHFPDTQDFIEACSDGGGAPAAVDFANGHLVCGCNSIDSCRPRMKFGDCSPQMASPVPAPAIAASETGTVATRGAGGGYKNGFNHSDSQQIQPGWLIGTGLIAITYSMLIR